MFRKQIAFLAINLADGESWKYMRKGYDLFHASREQILQYQDYAYQKLLRYAYYHTRYWKKVFDEINLVQNGKIIKENYKDIPILTKDIIRKEGMDLVSDEIRKRGGYSNTSGGSTGEPVRFFQDKEYFSHNFGDKILFGVLNGKKPGEKEIKLWGSERDILQGSIGLKEKAINWCFNRKFLNSFVLTPELVKSYVKIINHEKPKQIWAYADSIYQLAKFINENKIKVYSPQNIISTAGVLYDEMRKEIERAFYNSNLINQYGSREAGVIGCEIGKKDGMRIFEHSVKVEIVNERTKEISDSGEGDLLVTNLTNYTMPLIRYHIGDMGEISNNFEGYDGSFSILKKLTGRTNAHLKTQDGSLVHGEYVTHLFYNKNWIENFRVIQHDYEDIEFQIVLKRGCKAINEELEQMKDDLKKVIGECTIDVNYLNVIPKLKSGKYQFVISEIAL